MDNEAWKKDVRQRLINVEKKLDQLLLRDVPITITEPESVGLGKGQAFGSRTYAQHGDDLVILLMFRSLGIAKPSYLDLGAHHPLHISNTGLLYLRGSRGVNVEANPLLIEAFHTQRPEDITLNVGVAGAGRPNKMVYYNFPESPGLSTFDPEQAKVVTKKFGREPKEVAIPVTTIPAIVQEHCGGIFPDLLSIDVEGMETELLTSIDYNGSLPKLIVAEGNTEADRDALTAIMSANGFRRMFKAAENLFFVRADLADKVV